MSLIREIAGAIQTAGHGTLRTSGQPGGDMFVGELPNEPDNAILLVTAPSDPPDQYLETQYLTIDVWVRNKSTQAAYVKLEDIYKFLHRKANFDLASYYVHFVHAVSSEDDMEKDASKRKLFRQSYRCIYRNKSIVS